MHTQTHTRWLLYHLLPRLSQLVSAEEVLQACQCVFVCMIFVWPCVPACVYAHAQVCDVLLFTKQNRHTVQLSLTLMKSSQTTLIPPEGHCQNNKQLGFFKESYLSWTGEGCVCVCILFAPVCVCLCVFKRCASVLTRAPC